MGKFSVQVGFLAVYTAQTKDDTYMNCRYCQALLEDPRWNQLFCPAPAKCKSKYWNERMLDNLHNVRFTPDNYACMKSYAEAHKTSIDIIANEMFHKFMNPGERPLDDIMGVKDEPTA